MVTENVQSLHENGDTNTWIPNYPPGDKNKCTSNLKDSYFWIPKLEDINLHLVYSLIQFLNRYNM